MAGVARSHGVRLRMPQVVALFGSVLLFGGVNAWYLGRMRGAGKKFSLHARKLYNFDTLVFPGGLTVLARFLRRKAARMALSVAGTCLAARLYATHFEPRLLKIRSVRIGSSKLHRPVRILHLTDMESGTVRNRERKVIARARNLAPDLVFHTGDLLAPVEPATYQSELPKMARIWDPLEAPLGKFAVIGESDRPIRKQLRRGVGGLRLLDGETVRLKAPGLCLAILGLSFESSCNGEPEQVRRTVTRWLETAKPDEFTILAGHRPDFMLSVQDLPIDLCLAGHTHGGQIRVPFYGPFWTHSRVPARWSAGYRQIGRTRLNVSAGVGFEHGNGFPAVRVNCPPEMTLLEVLPEGGNS